MPFFDMSVQKCILRIVLQPKIINMKTLLSLFCSLVVCTLSLGQTNSTTDLTGRWHGTYTYLNKNYPMVIEFTQTDQKLSGTIFTHKKDSTQYASFTFEGSLKKSKVALKALKFLETKGLWCLPTYDLTLISINEQQMLEGRWKPNFHKNGCLIGVSGRMSIIKEQEIIAQPSNSVVQTNTNEEDDEHDAYTKGMIEGLKVREYHALIIGVNQYNDEDITDLDNPISDGQKLSNTLESFYNFKKENITFLKSPGRTEILDEMEKLSKELDDKDNLLIFYGGHGIWDEALEQGYWLPADATIDSKSKWISNSTIRDYIRSINTRHTLLISDACFSGGLLKQRGVGKALINVYKMTSRKAITSGTLTTVPDKSVFMEYLVKYLKTNDDPLISADQVFYQMKVSVMNNSPNNQVPQYGPIHQARDEGGEFVFLRIDP